MSKKGTTSKEITESKGVLPKMELLIIFVFFMSFIVWAMSKCGETQAAYAQNEDVLTTEETTEKESKATETTTETVVVATKDTLAKKAVKKTATTTEKITILYVVLDGLKLRKGPHLDSSIVRTIPINKEVYFLNDVTKFKQEINLGDRVAFEPWIKVRTYSGHEGWVYGAGVNYFKPQTVTDTLNR